MKETKRWLLLGLLIYVSCGRGLFAQNTNSGDIRGTATDATGALLPGVSVKVVDVDKGVTHIYVTDNAGLYDTGSITPDHYLITFTKDGFQTFVRGPITLDVSTETVNAAMKIGSTDQQVVVNTDVPLLSTESGAQEGTLSSQTMAQLPQTGADWENFVILLPGASGAPENSSNAANPGQVASINGNLPFESMLADGATTTLPMSQNSDVTIFETTQEVKVSVTGFSAQYGVGDIIYNQITKGGTNSFHGAGYEYFQNNALDAAPYAFGSTTATVPTLRYNNFGFAVGGPIIKNKLFFYFDYDKTINHGGASLSFNTVPTTALEAGDFTAPGLPTLYDPSTQTLQQTGSHTYTGSQYPNGALTVACPCVIRQTFDSEYHNGNVLPGSMISKVAQNIQAFWPAPNSTPQTVSSGIGQGNFFSAVPGSTPFTKYFGRLDYDITNSNRITVSVTESDNPVTSVGIGICPINCEPQDVSRHNAQVSDVWTISPRLINEARFGFTDQLNFFVPDTLNQGFPAKLGLQFAQADNFPQVSVGPFYELGNNGSTPNATYKEFVFDPSDVVTMIRGKHVLHFGGEFLINRADSTNWGNINAASIGYTGSYTAQGGQATAAYDGVSYADFLLGQTQNWSAGVTPEYGARWKSPQVFVQDDYKIRPNLTVNLGLRYEIETGWSEIHGNESTFDPTVVNPANNTLGATWYGFSHANGRTTLQQPKYNIVLPRIGFSYQPHSDTVIRGGFGIYASTWSEDTYGAGMGSAFGSSGNLTDNTNGACPVVALDSNGTNPDTTNPGCGTGNYNPNSILSKYLTAPTSPAAQNGQGVSYNQYHTPVPTNYQWTLSVQRQIGSDIVAELAYIGNHGKNLNFPVDINQVPEGQLGPNDVANQPYSLYQAITGSTNNAVSNYNALQAQMTKRMSHGLQFNTNYTWSHFLDDLDSSGWGSREGFQNYQNAYNPADNYSRSNFDIRSMFKGQAIYQLPVGKGRQFLNNNTLLDALIGGWQTSATFVVQGGNPIGITTGGNNSSNNQSGSFTQYANLIGNVQLSGSTKSRLGEWYNLSALAVPAPFTYGNFKRNIVSGPGLSEVNASLGKNFDLWPEHGIKLQIRADATNVLNHASFGQPGNNAIGNGESANITGTTVGGRTMQLYGRLSF
jgi:hypothetical protein